MQHSIVRLAPQVGKRVCYNGLVIGSLRLTGAPCETRRALSSSVRRCNELTNEKAKAAAVGPHMSQFDHLCIPCIARLTDLIEDSSLPPVSLPPGGDISSGGHHGDWVLFHPVYSPEELKAVEVGFVSTYSAL